MSEDKGNSNTADLRPVILRTKKVTKAFGGLVAVKEVDLEIKKGEIFGLIGPNGAGKTTLFNLISGVYRPNSGTIEFDGKAFTGIRRPNQVCRLGIARTFQVVKPFGNLTALENVMIGGFSRLRDEHQARKEAADILDYIGLGERKATPASSLTLADRKRLEVARALATKPKLLLLDEVMAGLTPHEIDETLPLLRRIREEGITLFVVEHVMHAIMSLSDRIAILHHGEKIMEGSPQEVAKDERVIKAYLGEEYVIS
jgi:branched-chain amino acid transport system ATP-binding protein